MEKYKIIKVLMPTDFSDLTESAFKVAISICKRQQAELTLLHVVDNLSYLASSEMFIPRLATTPDIFNTMKDNIEELALKLTLHTKIKVEGKVETGNPAYTICKVAAEGKYDLIVMGTHGASGLREFFIGSNAFSVVKHSPCPVLTIPGNWERKVFKKVVFPVRLLPGALEKYDYALPIIEQNGSDLLIIGLAEQERPESMVELTQLIDQFRLQLRDDNVEFSSVLHHSKVFPLKVIEAANGYDADLIIITANLDYDLKAYFIGPFAQQIVNHSKRPVLSIRSDIINDDKDLSPEIAIKNVSEKYLRLAF